MKHFIIALYLSTMGWFFLGTIPNSLLDNQDPIIQERLAQKLEDLIEAKKSNCQKVELEFIEDKENKNISIIYMNCTEWGI